MSFKALIYAYVLGGLTFIPLLICTAVAWSIYTSVPVGDPDPEKLKRKKLAEESKRDEVDPSDVVLNDLAKPRRAWLTVRRTFEVKETDGSYMNMMRAYLDSRSKDPKRSRPKDMWYVVLKGDVLYLYEDELMTECGAAIHLSMHDVAIHPEGLPDSELFTKRNAICLKPSNQPNDCDKELTSVTREMGLEAEDVDQKLAELDTSDRKKEKERARLEEVERMKAEAKAEAFDSSTPWFIFVRSCVEMEDWYHALVHAAHYHDSPSTLEPVRPVFLPSDMNHLVTTLDEQPDVIPMRWLNALLGRIFFSFYRTKNLESFIIGRLMKKLSKVKIPSFLQNVSVTEVSVGNTPPTFSKPMLKDLTKEGDAALEVRVMYKGEVRVTVQATAIINLGQRFKTYTVKLVLAIVLRKLDGNLLIKVKRPPTNRVWYAFTQPPEMDLDVEPVVSDRQIKWSMICSTIESRLKEIINESIVMPHMDDIAFFESHRYIHRGGIWADASRETSPGKVPEQNGVANEGGPELPVKSHSTDALAETNGATPAESDADTDNDRIETASAPILTQDPLRRRSWFASGLESSSLVENESGSSSKSIPSDQQQTTEDERGRSLSVDASARRATSVPASKGSPIETPNATEEASLSGSTITEPSQDGSSGHSRIRSLSSGAHTVASEHANSSRESLTSRQNNASSFLSTLKQKADKQALSNTAKEAMRKWSANWSGFKREHMGGSSRGEDTTEGAPSSTATSLFKARNYSDIRAAVSGRRDHSPAEESHEGSSSTQPIDIPTNKQNGEESGSNVGSASSGSNKDSEPSLPASPQASPKGPSLLRREGARATISPPRVTTETTHSPDNTPSTSTNVLSSPETPVPQPIRTQPSQGATMTIPGIHVSHRGDIQSYGYVPPALSTSASVENKQRTPTIPPTIQSMYKLFRSPTSNSSVLQQQQEQSRTPQASTSAETGPSTPSPARSEGHSRAPGANDDVTPLSLTPSPPDAPDTSTPTSRKPSPPPLPPRSGSLPHPPSTPPQLPPRRNPNVSPVVGESDVAVAPSASDALRAIAEQDDTKRRDIEASPELRPKGATSTKAKRTSLGARRITPAPVIFSDEPEPVHPSTENETSVRPSDSLPKEADQTDRRSVQQTNESPQAPEPAAAPAPAGAKPTPPPLPPRRPSTLSI